MQERQVEIGEVSVPFHDTHAPHFSRCQVKFGFYLTEDDTYRLSAGPSTVVEELQLPSDDRDVTGSQT